MVAHGPTFAATVGRRNHVEVMHFCPDLEGGFSQKVATFWTVPCKAGQIFLTHTIFQLFWVWVKWAAFFFWRYMAGLYVPPVHPSTCALQPTVEECSLLFIPICGTA